MFNKSKKKLIQENTHLKYRIKELEEKICPCESHEWVYISSDYRLNGPCMDIDTIYTYKCKKCGKIKKTLCPI
jgi:hypothetical protein